MCVFIKTFRPTVITGFFGFEFFNLFRVMFKQPDVVAIKIYCLNRDNDNMNQINTFFILHNNN